MYPIIKNYHCIYVHKFFLLEYFSLSTNLSRKKSFFCPINFSTLEPDALLGAEEDFVVEVPSSLGDLPLSLLPHRGTRASVAGPGQEP